MGRPPIGKKAMTATERSHRFRAKHAAPKPATKPATKPDGADFGAQAAEIARLKAVGAEKDREIATLRRRAADAEKEAATLKQAQARPAAATSEDRPSPMPKTAEDLAQAKQRAQEERKAKRAAARAAKPAEIPDEKTKEDYERQIKGLRTQVRNLKAALQHIAADPKKPPARNINSFFETAEDRRFALTLYHSDRFPPAKRKQAERVFQVLNNIPVIGRT